MPRVRRGHAGLDAQLRAANARIEAADQKIAVKERELAAAKARGDEGEVAFLHERIKQLGEEKIEAMRQQTLILQRAPPPQGARPSAFISRLSPSRLANCVPGALATRLLSGIVRLR